MDTWKQWLVLRMFFEEILDPGIQQSLENQPLSDIQGTDDPAFQAFLQMAGASHVTTTSKLFDVLANFRATHLEMGMHAHGDISAALYAMKDVGTGWLVMDQVFARIFLGASLSRTNQKYHESAAMMSSAGRGDICWSFGLETIGGDIFPSIRDAHLAVSDSGVEVCRLMDRRMPRLSRENIQNYILILSRNGDAIAWMLLVPHTPDPGILPDISNSLYEAGSHFRPDWPSIQWGRAADKYADNALLEALGKMDEGRGKHLVRGAFLEESLGI